MYRFFRKNREAVKKYLLIFFLSIVSIGMVITLAPIPGGDTNQMQSSVLASIGGNNITTQDLRQNLDTEFRNSPVGNNPHLMVQLAGNVLDEMVLRHALLGQAKKLGIEVSNQELMQTLKDYYPFLFPEGNFVGIERYTDFIQQQNGISVAQFEAQLRESIMLEKIRSIVTDALGVAPGEVHAEFLRRNAKAKVEYVQFEPKDFLQTVQVTPQVLENYFKQNPAKYKVAEQRQARYVLIEPEKIQSQVRVSDDELKQYYSQHISDYRISDRVHAAHILFKTTGKTPAEITALKQKASDVLKQAKSGTDFAELAKKYSEDTSASNGGDIGWIVRGQTVKEFEAAAFSMSPGAISDLITTTYGIHIIKVVDKQTAHLQTFDEVKDSIRALLAKQKADAVRQSYAAGLERQFQASLKDFEAVARKAGLEVKETPLFKYNQAVPDLGSDEGFHNLAFQMRVGDVGTPLSLPKGVAIIQLAQIVPEHLPKLEEVGAQVEEDYRSDQSKVIATHKAQEFAAKCKTGDFKKLAKDAGYTVKESKDFTQQDQAADQIPGSSLAAAFTLAPGQTSDVIDLGSSSVVFQVISHTAAEGADFPKQQDQIRQQLLDQKRNLAFEIYRKNLKQQMIRSGELKMNDNAMKQFLASFGGNS